jgi:2-keto-3-deoxy-L-rhamnonate aldolase RhmA
MTTFSEFGRLREGLDAGKKFINAFCSAPSSIIAEFLARQGFDSITIDLQHGLIDYQTSVAMLQSIASVGIPSLCRVPWNDPIPVMKALEAGFEGIICPMITVVKKPNVSRLMPDTRRGAFARLALRELLTSSVRPIAKLLTTRS